MALGPYFDPLGETELEDTIYTLAVRRPPRPRPKWLSTFRSRTPVKYLNSPLSTYTIMPDETNANLDCFEEKHLEDMSRKHVKIKRALYPLEMRCDHFKENKTCMSGCYVQEKGGHIWQKKCTRSDRAGHVYVGLVKEDEEKKSCIGKKGERLVCIEKRDELL